MSTTTAKVSVETKELMRCLNLASKCVSTKPTIPILGNVLLTYKPEVGFVMSASNIELWIDIPVKMNLMEGEFSQICISYNMLKNAVATLPQESTLELLFVDGRLKVDYKKGKFSVPTENAADYPISTDIATSETAEKAAVCKFRIDAGWLVYNIRTAKICAAQETLRPIINSVCLDVSKASINVVSTDQHTLFFNSTELPAEDLLESDFETNVPVILSLPTVDAICSSFTTGETIVTADDTHVSLLSVSTGVKLIARLVEGSYVPYDKILSAESDKMLRVELNDILGAIKRCSVFANEVSHLATLTNEGDGVRIMVNNIDNGVDCGEFVKKLEGTTLDEDGFRIAFNILKLNSLLSAVTSENMIINMSAATNPIIIKNDDELSNLILLIMPMMV